MKRRWLPSWFVNFVVFGTNKNYETDKTKIGGKLGSGCGSVGTAVASDSRGP